MTSGGAHARSPQLADTRSARAAGRGGPVAAR